MVPTMILLAASASSDTFCDLFVATDGSDGNDGRAVASPFQTLQHAIWRQGSKGNCPRTICLRSGVYRLNATVQVSASFAHAGCPLLVRTFPDDMARGERAVLSGGVRVGPFVRKDPSDAWLTAAPPAGAHRPSLMYAPGAGSARLQRARLPKRASGDATNRFTGDASTFRYAGPLQPPDARKVWPAIDHTGFFYNSSDLFAGMLPLYRQDEVQVLHFHSWTAFWSNISGISDGVLKFTTPTKTPVGQWAKQGGQRFLLENVKEGMSEPGDWYWDDGKGEVLLIPSVASVGTSSRCLSSLAELCLSARRATSSNCRVCAGKHQQKLRGSGCTQQNISDFCAGSSPAPSPNAAVFVEAAQLPVLMQISGASHVSLADIEFTHADVGDRVDQYYTRSSALKLGPALTTDIRIERVRVRQSGGVGISIGDNVQRVEILDSAVMDVGASGIEVQNGVNCTDILINNSLINDTARIILGQPGGIRAKGQRNMTITHNTVGFTPYAGIMIGWQAITEDLTKQIFDIGFNHIHNYGMGILSDFGGIYLSSSDNLCFQKQPALCHLPTHVHQNWVHKCSRYNYGCQGVYMDEQVSGVLIENNLLQDLDDQGVYFHCGSDNVAANNIITSAGLGSSIPSGGRVSLPPLEINLLSL
eukprot:COSAG05_NODE_679_length_7979_cov_22.454442_10_plen_646_part_00